MIFKDKKSIYAFTLIELLATITILGILLLIAVPSINQLIYKSRIKTLQASLLMHINTTKSKVLLEANQGAYLYSFEETPFKTFAEWNDTSKKYDYYVSVGKSRYDNELLFYREEQIKDLKEVGKIDTERSQLNDFQEPTNNKIIVNLIKKEGETYQVYNPSDKKLDETYYSVGKPVTFSTDICASDSECQRSCNTFKDHIDDNKIDVICRQDSEYKDTYALANNISGYNTSIVQQRRLSVKDIDGKDLEYLRLIRVFDFEGIITGETKTSQLWLENDDSSCSMPYLDFEVKKVQETVYYFTKAEIACSLDVSNVYPFLMVFTIEKSKISETK